MDTLFLYPGTSVTTESERAALVELASTLTAKRAALIEMDEQMPETSLVFGAGLTQHEEQIMCGDATVRATKGRFWLSNNGHHIGDWDLAQVEELARFIEVSASFERDEDDRY